MPALADWVSRTPDQIAVTSPAGARTFAELDANANRLAHTLRDAVWLPVTRLHCSRGITRCSSRRCSPVERAGYRLTPVNWHLTAEEAAYIVDDCEAKALVTTGELVGVAAPARANARRCTVAPVADGTCEGFEQFEQAIAVEPATALPDPEPGTTMLYTSGTTGRPKGVHRGAVAASGAVSVNLGGYDEAGGDVHLCTGPLYHAAPLAFSLGIPLAFGATVVLMEALGTRRKPCSSSRITASLTLHGADDVPPFALAARTRGEHADVSSLRYVLHGAAPCPVSIKGRSSSGSARSSGSTTPRLKGSAVSSTPQRGSNDPARSGSRSSRARWSSATTKATNSRPVRSVSST